MEEEIIHLLRQKDEQGLHELLRHYTPLLRYVIAPILPSEQDREECLSEAAMRVWDKIDTYDPSRGKWTAWLTAIARNSALNKLRAKREDSEELSDALPSHDPSPEDTLVRQETLSALQQAIETLPQGDRILFYRKYYYRQPTAQIARELGMTARAVEGRLYRIKKLLREKLGGDGNE